MKHLIFTLAASSVLALTACKGDVKTPEPAPAPSETAQPAAANSAAKTPAKTSEKTDGVRLKAVLIYADWCGSCKILDPKVEAIKAGQDFAGTEFVKLDFTDKNRKAFVLAAREAKVGRALKPLIAEKIKTGQLVLVDMDDRKIVGVIKKDMSEADMIAAITAAADGA